MTLLPCSFTLADSFPKRPHPFYVLTSDGWGFQFLHILIKVHIVCFDYSNSNGCDVVSIVVLIYISLWLMSFLVANDVENFSMYLLSIYISSLENIFSSHLSIYTVYYLSFYYWIVSILYILWIKVSYERHDFKIFFPILWVVFSLVW